MLLLQKTPLIFTMQGLFSGLRLLMNSGTQQKEHTEPQKESPLRPKSSSTSSEEGPKLLFTIFQSICLRFRK